MRSILAACLAVVVVYASKDEKGQPTDGPFSSLNIPNADTQGEADSPLDNLATSSTVSGIFDSGALKEMDGLTNDEVDSISNNAFQYLKGSMSAEDAGFTMLDIMDPATGRIQNLTPLSEFPTHHASNANNMNDVIANYRGTVVHMFQDLNKQKAVLNKQMMSLSQIKELVEENEKTYHMNVNATNGYSALVHEKLASYDGHMGNVTSLYNSTADDPAKKGAKFVEVTSSVESRPQQERQQYTRPSIVAPVVAQAKANTFSSKLQRLKERVEEESNSQ